MMPLINGYLAVLGKIQINTPWQNSIQCADKPWPYGEKLPEGKIHVKTADVSGKSVRTE
jgi:hypothetical protein